MTKEDVFEARCKLFITQKKLAEKLGVTERTVRRWECGVIPVPGPVARLIDRILKEEGFNRV